MPGASTDARVAARDVAAADERRRRAADHHRERPGALRNRERHGHRRRLVGLWTVLDLHDACDVAVAGRFALHGRLEGRRLGRHAADVPLLEELSDLGAPRGPVRGVPDGPAVHERERVGQEVVARKCIEIRRELAGPLLPLVERGRVRQRLEHPLEIGAPFLLGRGAERIGGHQEPEREHHAKETERQSSHWLLSYFSAPQGDHGNHARRPCR